MPIELTIHKTVALSDIWCDKNTWDEEFEGNLDALVKLLNEDWLSIIEDCGGLKGLVQSARWKEINHG